MWYLKIRNSDCVTNELFAYKMLFFFLKKRKGTYQKINLSSFFFFLSINKNVALNFLFSFSMRDATSMNFCFSSFDFCAAGFSDSPSI